MTAPTISIPRQFTGLTLSRVADSVVQKANNGWPPELIFDFAELNFIKPAGVVFLSNLFHWLKEKGCEPTFDHIDGNSQALRFLDDSLFFEQHCGSKVRATSSPRETTRPLLKIAQKDSHNWLEFNLLPWLAGRLSITPASLFSLKASVSELFNNIQDHTRYDIGSTFQMYTESPYRCQTSGLAFQQRSARECRALLTRLQLFRQYKKALQLAQHPETKVRALTTC